MVKMGYTKPEGWDKEHLQEPCLNQPPKCKPASSRPPKTVNTTASFKNKWSKSRPPLTVKKIQSADAKKSTLPSTNKKHAYKQLSGFSTQRAMVK
jgi:hypothetical protein